MTLIAAILFIVLGAVSASPLQKLGLYDFFVDESSPVVFNGRVLMFESIVQASPQWAGNWDPAFASCSCYFRVRDQSTGVVLVNITETCNHAFGEAFVQTNDEGLDTLFVFGTPWIRMNTPLLQWSGPCTQNNCSVDAFYTSDPSLTEWRARPFVVFPRQTVYNNDVGHVGPPSVLRSPHQSSPSAASSSSDPPSPLPPHQWVMILETGAETSIFYVSNSSDPTDASGWTALDPSVYTTDRFNGQVGSCPSIRFDPSSGYYYVLTGGNQILLLRSKTLMKGSWEAASSGGVFLSPDSMDCVVLRSPPFGGWYTPDPVAAKHIAGCSSASGFGNDSDVDLSEVIVNGTIGTLVQYGSGDQATFGFSNLAFAPGVRMFDLLESYF